MDSIEKNAELALLMDTYGALLTERQAEVARMRLDEDMTYQEIAEALGVSKQSAYELMKGAQAQLEAFETALHISERTRAIEREIKNCEEALDAAKAALARLQWIER